MSEQVNQVKERMREALGKSDLDSLKELVSIAEVMSPEERALIGREIQFLKQRVEVLEMQPQNQN